MDQLELTFGAAAVARRVRCTLATFIKGNGPHEASDSGTPVTITQNWGLSSQGFLRCMIPC